MEAKDETGAVEGMIRDEERVEEELAELESNDVDVERDPNEVETVDERMNVKFATVVPTAASVNEEMDSVAFPPAGLVTTKVEELRRAEMELAD